MLSLNDHNNNLLVQYVYAGPSHSLHHILTHSLNSPACFVTLMNGVAPLHAFCFIVVVCLVYLRLCVGVAVCLSAYTDDVY